MQHSLLLNSFMELGKGSLSHRSGPLGTSQLEETLVEVNAKPLKLENWRWSSTFWC